MSPTYVLHGARLTFASVKHVEEKKKKRKRKEAEKKKKKKKGYHRRGEVKGCNNSSELQSMQLLVCFCMIAIPTYMVANEAVKAGLQEERNGGNNYSTSSQRERERQNDA